MGSSGSQLGVKSNPRVELANNETVSVKQRLTIDTPSLIKLSHGTVRYREVDTLRQPVLPTLKRPKEVPHEGDERERKLHYFYHAKLNDFSQDGSYQKEDPARFHYVYRTPKNSRQKKVYYVMGVGLQSEDGGQIMESPDGDEFPFRPAKAKAIFPLNEQIFYSISFGESVTIHEDEPVDTINTDSEKKVEVDEEVAGDQDDSAKMEKEVRATKILKKEKIHRLPDVEELEGIHEDAPESKLKDSNADQEEEDASDNEDHKDEVDRQTLSSDVKVIENVHDDPKESKLSVLSGRGETVFDLKEKVAKHLGVENTNINILMNENYQQSDILLDSLFSESTTERFTVVLDPVTL